MPNAALIDPLAALPPHTVAQRRYDQVSDRCERFRDKLDAHLATLSSDAERRRFLDVQAETWAYRYREFQIEVGIGTHRGDETAFEYLITIADIDARLGRYPAAVEPYGSGQRGRVA